MSKRNKHIIGLLIGLLCFALLTAGLKSCDKTVKLPGFNVPSVEVDDAAKKVDDLISGIATPITLGSADAIAQARHAYDALSDADKLKVKLLEKLQGYELDLAKLGDGTDLSDLIANNAADLDNLLSGIKLTLTNERLDLLGKIRAAFNALTPEEKANFKGLNLLEGFELAKDNDATKLDELLNGISLPITADSAGLLAKIRAAYDALSEEAKAKFAGLDKLNSYEVELNNLLAGGGVEAVKNLINSIGAPITLSSEAAINDALAAYNALSDADKAKVSNYNTLLSYLNQLNALKNGASQPKTGID